MCLYLCARLLYELHGKQIDKDGVTVTSMQVKRIKFINNRIQAIGTSMTPHRYNEMTSAEIFQIVYQYVERNNGIAFKGSLQLQSKNRNH